MDAGIGLATFNIWNENKPGKTLFTKLNINEQILNIKLSPINLNGGGTGTVLLTLNSRNHHHFLPITQLMVKARLTCSTSDY